jgi:hypothetical protein
MWPVLIPEISIRRIAVTKTSGPILKISLGEAEGKVCVVLWSEMGVAAAGSQLRMVRILPRLPGEDSGY